MEKRVNIDLKKLPTLKKVDLKKEKILNEILIKENRLGLRYLEEK